MAAMHAAPLHGLMHSLLKGCKNLYMTWNYPFERFMKALHHRKRMNNGDEKTSIPYKSFHDKKHKGTFYTGYHHSFRLFNHPTSQAETIETDIGLPLYPGSKEIPDYIPVRTGQNHSSFQNITFITSDSFKKVLAFYQERLGKFSTSKPQTSAKSALWSESTAKGYRIVTLIEAEEGTKITITARTW